MRLSFKEETRQKLAHIREYIKEYNNTSIRINLCGTSYKKEIMLKELEKAKRDNEIDVKIGVISKEEYELEAKVLFCFKESLKNFEIF